MLTLIFILIAVTAAINLLSVSTRFSLSVQVHTRPKISTAVRFWSSDQTQGWIGGLWKMWIEIFCSWVVCENRFSLWMGWGARFFCSKYLLVAKVNLYHWVWAILDLWFILMNLKRIFWHFKFVIENPFLSPKRHWKSERFSTSKSLFVSETPKSHAFLAGLGFPELSWCDHIEGQGWQRRTNINRHISQNINRHTSQNINRQISTQNINGQISPRPTAIQNKFKAERSRCGKFEADFVEVKNLKVHLPTCRITLKVEKVHYWNIGKRKYFLSCEMLLELNISFQCNIVQKQMLFDFFFSVLCFFMKKASELNAFMFVYNSF